jgi:hypothetical protein
MIHISLRDDFSTFPFGMLETDGEASGYFFRKNHLLPALNNSTELILIDVTVQHGLGSSFLIGAFSYVISEINPITNKNYTFEEIQARVKFIDQEKSHSEIPDIWRYMKEIEDHSYPNHNKNPKSGDNVTFLNEKFVVESISKCRCYLNMVDHNKEIPTKECFFLSNKD